MRDLLATMLAIALLAAVPAPARSTGGEKAEQEGAAAHGEGGGAREPAGEEAAEGQDGNAAFLEAVATDLENTGGKLASLAEAIPADKYGWAPAEGVRTVSQVLMHVAGTNLLLPSALGAAPPEGLSMEGGPMATLQRWEQEVTAKEDVLARLRESFRHVVRAVQEMDPATLDDEVAPFGRPNPKRRYLFILLTHAHEHLGQSIAYARSIGVVPPWSRPAAGEEGEG